MSLAMLVCAFATPAQAQSAASGAGVWEIGGGGVFVGGYDLGERTAELTPNTGTSTPVSLFTTDNKVLPVFGVQARVGYVVSTAVVIEAGFRFTQPVYEVRVTGDFENAPNTTIEEKLSEYVFDGSAVWHFTGAAFADGRAVPFVFAGAGYIRELHDQDALVEEGFEYHAGLGLKWWFNESRRGFGIRGDVGISIRDGAFDFEDGRRIVPVAGGSLIYRF
jgi:hypothetical protein